MGTRSSKMAQPKSDQTSHDEALINGQGKSPPPNLPTLSVPYHTTSNPAQDLPQTPSSAQPRSRRGSFSFLRRSKSREIAPTKTGADGGRKLSRRKNRTVSKEEAARAQVGMVPQLPSYHNLPQMNTPFVDGSSDNQNPQQPPATTVRYSPSVNTAEKPVSRSGYNPNAFYQRHLMAERGSTQSKDGTPPAAAGSTPSPQNEEAFARTESMTNRGRYSYASTAVNGSVSSPRRMRRRKDPTPFNILVVGTKGSGKTSFVEFLQQALTRPVRMRHAPSANLIEPVTKKEQNSIFTSHYLETDLEGERIGLTVYDSNGLEKHLIDLQLREFSYFLESKFQETFNEEQKVLRATGIRDTHIHCVFLVLDPARLDVNVSSASTSGQGQGDIISKPRVVGGLDQDLDVDLLKTLQGKTTVVPVISKADTVTTAHMAYLKRIVWDSLKKLKIDPLEALNLDSDDEGEDAEPSLPTVKKHHADELKVEDDGKPDASVSSVYDSAREGDDSDAQSDSTVNNEPGKSKPTDKVVGAASTIKNKHPHHDEIDRFSTMSENVDLPMLPLSIISPDMHDPGVVGRRFPWGFADPYNVDHCDFTRLLESVFNEWRAELREASRERWYEGWRTNRLRTRGTIHQSPPTTRMQPGGRTVSGAMAYGGKGPESQLKPPSVTGASSTASRTVSASDIGVAVSSNGTTSKPPPVPSNVPTSVPKSSYRGVGTY